MQMKIALVTVGLLVPFAVSAQGPNANNTTVAEGKKIAMNNDPMVENKGVPKTTIDTIIISRSPKVTDKEASPVSGLKANKLNKVFDNATTAAELAKFKKTTTVKPLDRVVRPNEKFKEVPLAGETEYFGKMNGVMVDYVKKYMNNFGGRLHGVNSRHAATFATIEKVLEKHSIPQELKYLAVIESALNKNAVSPVGATGYWQFMESTATLMGLKVTAKRDDRTDLVKSTNAAAKYLSYLYDQLDDWLLVVAAYNSGPRPVIRAINKTGKDDFWSIKQYLPKETQNHVMAFVATATIFERLNHFLAPGVPVGFDWASLNVAPKVNGIAPQKPKNPLLSKFTEEEIKSMTIVRIKRPLDLEVVSHTLTVDRRTIGRWNYDYFDYLETYKAGNQYNFRIPKDKLDLFLEKLNLMEQMSAKTL